MKDKIVVITGGNDGIGFATAKALAIKGATIILLSRNLDKAEKAVEEIKQVCHHQQVSFIHIDFYDLYKRMLIIFFIPSVMVDAGENSMNDFVSHSI